MPMEQSIGWAELVRRLRTEPLAQVVAGSPWSEAEAIARLVAEGEGGAADAAPWWPEALRRLAVQSLRAVARQFSTEPRRIRRALARTGVRVAGAPVGEDGPAQLLPFRSRLGQQPDGVIARAARVTPEAVAGERRRLGVPAHVQRRRRAFTEEEVAWIRGPKRGRRERFRPEPERLDVVRRPSARPGEVERVMTPVRAADPLPTRTPSLPPGPPPEVEGLRRREFFRSDDATELQRLLQPSLRPRDGRQRIVRADAPRPEPAPPRADPRPTEPAPGPRRRVVTRPEPESRVAVGPPRLPRGAGEPLRPVEPAVTRPAPRAGEPRRIVRAEPARMAAPAVEVLRVPGRVEAAPAVLREATAAAALVAPDPVPTAPAPALLEWHVYLPDVEAPMVVYAADIAGAARAAALKVPAELLAEVSIWRADATQLRPDWL